MGMLCAGHLEKLESVSPRLSHLPVSFYLSISSQTHPCWLWWYNNCVFLPGTFPHRLRQMVQVLTGWANTRKMKAAGTDWCPDGCVRQRQEIEVTAGGVYPRGWTARSHKHTQISLEKNHGNLWILRFRVTLFSAQAIKPNSSIRTYIPAGIISGLSKDSMRGKSKYVV